MNKKKVYIADDDPDILEVLTIILQDKGYQVTTSPDGKSSTTKMKPNNTIPKEDYSPSPIAQA